MAYRYKKNGYSKYKKGYKKKGYKKGKHGTKTVITKYRW